jgi:hypothetical protein
MYGHGKKVAFSKRHPQAPHSVNSVVVDSTFEQSNVTFAQYLVMN